MEPGKTRIDLSQLRRGTIEYCGLAVLRGTERYGFELVRMLSEVDGMVITEGTIYPLLSRLRQEKLVTTSWRESESGPPRRYYRLTKAGERALSDFAEGWAVFRNAVDQLLEEKGEKDDHDEH
ncbi:MAG: PadR family transcriptional regulator [Acidimicrobiia bacterium]